MTAPGRAVGDAMNERSAPRARRLPAVLTVHGLGLLAVLGVLAGCSPAKKVLVGNLAPETVITVNSVAPDTLRGVDHLIRLSWFGSDPDGDVVAYELRMFNDVLPADTAWVRLNCASTSCNDSLFTIAAPNGFTRARLQVRAVDNQGSVDPSPAEQSFSFLNQAPICDILTGPGVVDSSYASVSITWNVDDRGGDLSRLSFRVYLDGNEANYDSVYTGASTGSYTVPSSRFIQGAAPGMWLSGFRKVFVRAVDDGGRLGPPDSLRWYVRSPGLVPLRADSTGRALLIDNSFRTASNDLTVDTLYHRTLARNLPAGRFSVLHLDVNNPFHTARDLAQTFRQFDAVIWYRGFDTFAATTLTAYQDSVAQYIRNGGRFYIEGLNMIEGPGLITIVTPPMLRESFMTEFLNCVGQRKFFNPTIGDSSVAWGTRNFNDVLPPLFRSSVLQDSMLLSQAVSPGVRVFIPRDTSEVAFWARPNALEPPVPEQLAAMMSVRQPSGGRVVAVPLPIRLARPTFVSSSRLLAKLLFHPGSGLFAP